MDERLKQIEKDRGDFYGDPYLSHQALGLIIEGIFRNRYHDISDKTQHLIGRLIPADLFAEFMAGLKLGRAARPVYIQDSFDDLHVYTDFAERFFPKPLGIAHTIPEKEITLNEAGGDLGKGKSFQPIPRVSKGHVSKAHRRSKRKAKR